MYHNTLSSFPDGDALITWTNKQLYFRSFLKFDILHLSLKEKVFFIVLNGGGCLLFNKTVLWKQ